MGNGPRTTLQSNFNFASSKDGRNLCSEFDKAEDIFRPRIIDILAKIKAGGDGKRMKGNPPVGCFEFNGIEDSEALQSGECVTLGRMHDSPMNTYNE